MWAVTADPSSGSAPTVPAAPSGVRAAQASTSSAPEPTPFDQRSYQVRLDWGVDGLARLAPADVVVVVDVLRFSTTVTRRLEHSADAVSLDADADAMSTNGAPLARAAEASGAVVLLGGVRNATSVARACLAIQHERAARTSVAVIPAGELTGREPGATLRFAVEDLLGAGAVVAALSALGTDHTSPDAAAACEAYVGLGRAVAHLLTASGSGLELAERGLGDEVRAAAAIDATDVVPVLRGGAFVAR